MSAIIGIDATTCPNGPSIPNIVGWTVNREAAILETTSCSDTERKNRTGLKNSSGTVTAICDTGTSILDVPQSGTVRFYLDGTKYVECAVIYHTASISWTIDGRTEVTYSWTQSGSGYTRN